jgi:hypothetical protein
MPQENVADSDHLMHDHADSDECDLCAQREPTGTAAGPDGKKGPQIEVFVVQRGAAALQRQSVERVLSERTRR